MLGNIATAKRVGVQSVFNQSNIQAVYDVYGSVQNRDLGTVAAAIQKIVAEVEPRLKPGNHIVVRGQIESMRAGIVARNAQALAADTRTLLTELMSIMQAASSRRVFIASSAFSSIARARSCGCRRKL